jgi:hypothetical protein
MTALYFIYRDDPGPVLWSVSGNTKPDLSFDAGLHLIQPPDGTPDTPGAYMVQNGTLAPRTATLAENRFAKTNGAVAHYNALIAAGFSYGGTLFQIDGMAQANIAAMGVMALGSITDPAGSPWPAGFYWIAADNSHVTMDAAAMYAFGRAAGAYVSACVLRLRAIKDAIAAAADQAALDAIDVTAGYPQASA